jgi:hypothetical protein
LQNFNDKPLTDMNATEHPVFVMEEGTVFVGAPGEVPGAPSR